MERATSLWRFEIKVVGAWWILWENKFTKVGKVSAWVQDQIQKGCNTQWDKIKEKDRSKIEGEVSYEPTTWQTFIIRIDE